MKILFDQAVPVPLRASLRGHLVRTAFQEGWNRLRNGDLIQIAEDAGFDLLLTTDRNIKYQQDLSGRRIALLVIDTQQWHRLRPQVELVIAEVSTAKPGSYCELSIPSE